MPKRSSKDPNRIAFDIVQNIIVPEGKNPAAVALGRLGGAKGGKARAASLSPKRRSDIAKRAARARWKGHKAN